MLPPTIDAIIEKYIAGELRYTNELPVTVVADQMREVTFWGATGNIEFLKLKRYRVTRDFEPGYYECYAGYHSHIGLVVTPVKHCIMWASSGTSTSIPS